MRIIKFRGQDEDGKWLYGDLRQRMGFWPAIIESYCTDEGKVGYREIAVKEKTVGQFTGLRDINGKDIYEGDILAVNHTDEKSYLEVRFVRGVFAFLWNGDLDDEFPCNAPTHEWAKVIGNIYDNPKLLKRH